MIEAVYGGGFFSATHWWCPCESKANVIERLIPLKRPPLECVICSARPAFS